MGVVLVSTDRALNCTFGMSYTPQAITRVMNGKNAEAGIAPASWVRFSR